MSEKRRLEKEVELAATPEQVWQAIATGPGISTWFVPHEVEEREGGKARADFGSGNVDEGRVLEWEPGRRVVYGGSSSDPGETLEFLVEGREGGSTILRLVQSGFSGEDWEAEYHSKGWDGFFHNLVQYFTHFAGLPVVNVLVMGFTKLTADGVWQRFNEDLGVPATVRLGERVRLNPSGLDPISGVVDVCERGVLGVRSDQGLHRFAGEGIDAWGMLSVVHYFYGVEMDRAQATEAWQAWLDRLFPEPFEQ